MRNTSGISSGWKKVTLDGNLISYGKPKNAGKGNNVSIKESLNA